MSNESSQPNSPSGASGDGPGSITQQVHYSHLSARLPEKINRGTFATNVLVLGGAQELVCDFLLRMVPPAQLAARVVLPYSALGPVVSAVAENLESFKARFGAPPVLPPPPPNAPPPNIAEVYEQMKTPDEIVVGAYANTLMITHTAAEFCLDFILDAFPRPVVTNRIYLSAPQIAPWLETLKRTLAQYQARLAGGLPPTQTPPPRPPET